MKTNKLQGPKIILIILSCASFLLYSMYFNGFGTNSAAIMAFFSVDEAGNGMILTLQAVGCIFATVFLGLYGERINKIYGTVVGLIIMGIAGTLIGFLPGFTSVSAYTLMLVFSLIAGVGYVIIELLMNGVISDVFPHKKTTFIPYVHAFYGMGAMFAPIFVTRLVNPAVAVTFARPYLIIGIGSIVVGLFMAFSGRLVTASTPYADMGAVRKRAKDNPAEIFKDARAWLYLLATFLYIAFQMGISTWLPTYCAEKLGYTFENAGLMVTLYFLGGLTTRFLSPLIYKKISVRNFFIITLLVSGTLFFAFLLLNPGPLAAKVIIVLMGLLQGTSVPALVILCCETFPERTASASAVVVFAISLSTLFLPTLMGALMKTSGYTLPMLMVTACLFLSVLVIIPIRRLEKKTK